MKLDHDLIPLTKINMKTIIHRQGLDIIFEENIGKNLIITGLSNNFSDIDTKGASNRNKNHQEGPHKTLKLLLSKWTKWKLNLQMGKFAKQVSDKRLISKIKNSYNSITTASTIWLEKAEELSKHFSKEDIQMANMYMKW